MCRIIDERFHYCVQESRAETGFEVVIEEEKKAFIDMIRSMLVYKPRERATAQQVTYSDWVKLGTTGLERRTG